MGVVAAGAFALSASAGVTPIGPFTGDHSESFDGGPQVIFTPCVSTAWGYGVFDDMGDLCTPGNSGCHTTSGWGFYCTIFSRTGTFFFGSAGGYAEYTFDTPVSQFGGYFGSNAYDVGETPGADINFYDANGRLIDSVRLDMPDRCQWYWNGWSSDTPVARIECINDKFGGAFLDMDDMEMSLGGPSDCLTLTVNPLFAGGQGNWDVSGATPGEQVAVVYGFNPGTTAVNGYAGYCATFGIQGVNQNKLICRKLADGNGDVSCSKKIPAGVKGRRVLSQAAMRNTCPDECMSNLDDQVIQ
jgi:hypothetical protein